MYVKRLMLLKLKQSLYLCHILSNPLEEEGIKWKLAIRPFSWLNNFKFWFLSTNAYHTSRSVYDKKIKGWIKGERLHIQNSCNTRKWKRGNNLEDSSSFMVCEKNKKHPPLLLPAWSFWKCEIFPSTICQTLVSLEVFYDCLRYAMLPQVQQCFNVKVKYVS